jgi:hypothetical protein
MFGGHYGVAFAVKNSQNRILLWVLFIGVQLLDYVWATLVLLCIEKLRVFKGFSIRSLSLSFLLEKIGSRRHISALWS